MPAIPSPARALLGALLLSVVPGAAAAAEAVATLSDVDGNHIGSVSFTDTSSGMVLVMVALEGLPSGVHAIHIHQTGDCSAPDFSSAGDHLALGYEHGVKVEGGPHPGDLPNLHVGGDGAVTVEYFIDRISLAPDAPASLFDNDGSAIVVHTGADDYASQPSGDAGDRLACGVIEGEVETQ